MSNVKARFKDATLDQALELVKKRKPSRKGSYMATARMFRKAKKLWEGDEYDKAESPREKGIRNKHAKPKVTLPTIGFLNRRMDGET